MSSTDNTETMKRHMQKKNIDENEHAIVRYLLYIPSPVSIDVLTAVTGISSVRILNIMEKLRRKRLVHVKRGYEKGFYFTDPLLSGHVTEKQTSKDERESIVKDLIRYYADTTGDGKEKTLILGELHSKTGRVTDAGFSYVWAAACILEHSGEEEKAANYYKHIREHFNDMVPTDNNLTIFFESVLRENALVKKPEPVDDRIDILMKAGAVAKQHGRWDYFVRIALEWCSDLNVAAQTRKAVRYVNALSRLAERIDSPQIRRLIDLTMSEIHFYKGFIAEAAGCYEKTVGDLEEFGDNKEVLQVSSLVGWCNVMCGRVARGMGMLEGVRTKARLLNLKRASLLADLMYVQALLEMRKLKEAETILNGCEVSPFAGRSLDHFIAWHIERAKTYILYAGGEYEKAFERQKEAIGQLRSFGWMPKHTPWSLESLQGLETEGFINENMRYQREIERLIKDDDIYLKGFALRFRAEGKMRQGRFGKDVLTDLMNSEKYLIRAGAAIELARTRITLGNFYLKKGIQKRAQVYLEKAWNFFSTIDKSLFPTSLVAILPQEQKIELLMNRVIDLNESLGTIRDASSLLQRILHLAIDFTMAMRGGFVMMESGDLKMAVSRNVDPTFLSGEDFIRMGQVIKEVFRTGAEIIIPALNKDNKVSTEIMRKMGINSFICIPAKLGAHVYGCLCLDSRIDGTPFPEESLLFLRVLCSQIALGLSGIGIYDEMRKLKDHYEEEATFYKQEMGIVSPLETIIGESEIIVRVVDQVRQVAVTDSSVLILGETGVGKELIAKAIHNLSKRKEGPFIPVNLAALPQELVVSELFGHEKGSFTGASERRKGRFELADRGTIFLDEIGDLSQNMQVKLLRVLQEGTFERLGSAKPIRSDFRVIAATNKDLRIEVERGAFRQDLFYRLDVFPIYVPPLRERKEDLILLAHHFVDKYNKKLGKRIKHIPGGEIKRLLDYHWPGNVRELEHFVERAVIFSDGHHISFSGLEYKPDGEKIGGENLLPLSLADVERNHIKQVLKKKKWKIYGKDGAADVLGLKPSTLQSRMKKLGIERPM